MEKEKGQARERGGRGELETEFQRDINRGSGDRGAHHSKGGRSMGRHRGWWPSRDPGLRLHTKRASRPGAGVLTPQRVACREPRSSQTSLGLLRWTGLGRGAPHLCSLKAGGKSHVLLPSLHTNMWPSQTVACVCGPGPHRSLDQLKSETEPGALGGAQEGSRVGWARPDPWG